MRTRMKLTTVLLLLMLVGGLQATASAQSVNVRENRIVGLWDVQVTNLNCTTGGQVSSFRAMHKYELGGTAQVVPATNPAALSAHLGVWRHVQWNDYTLSVKTFRFDAAGNNIGWIIIKANVAINDSATGYAGSGQAEIFDAGGTMIAKSCPTFAGTRFVPE